MPREHDTGVTYRVGLVVGVTVSAVLTSWLVGIGVQSIAGDKMAPWILGRAAGLTSYLLLVGLYMMNNHWEGVLPQACNARAAGASKAVRVRATSVRPVLPAFMGGCPARFFSAAGPRP